MTFGKLFSVRTPSPPTAGPQENGPAVKSMNAHLKQNVQCIFKYQHSNMDVLGCNWMGN